MGAFFTNYQVRGKPASEVCVALAPLVEDLAYVSPEKGGWVTVYDFASDSQDQKILNRLAAELSKALNTAVFAFLVHDSDIAAYWLYRNGVLEDEFNSSPEYFGEVSKDEKSRLSGKVDKLLPLCVTSTSRAQMEEVIHPADGFPTFVEQIFEDLSKLLGIDDARMSLGFKCFEQEGEEILDDASKFVPVGRKAPRKKTQPPKRAAKRATVTPDFFPPAVGIMTQCWSSEENEKVQAMSDRYPNRTIDVKSELNAGYDGVALKFLRLSSLGAPTFKQLKSARDEGPDALAELLVQLAPTQLGGIANGAIEKGLVQFIAALLTNGMDPNTQNQHGEILLTMAERCGKPEIYNLFKSAIEKKK